MRFMDHALGRFMALARAAPYYDDTIFVFYGDHGSPAWRFPPHELPLRQQHVPLVLHAPGRLAPRRVDAVASSLDVLPTLARLAGAGHLNSTLGRDLLAERPDDARFAFVTTGRSQGLVTRDWFYGRDPAGRETLYRALPDGSLGAEDLAAREPRRLREAADLARAVATSAAWLLLNNEPRPHEQRANASAAVQAAAAPASAGGTPAPPTPG
jgi:arylsulfatase A-like enzyme